MRLVFLMKLELRDATDSLHAYLWRDAVSGGGVGGPALGLWWS